MIDEIFHKGDDADRQSDPDQDSDCVFELHARHRRKRAGRRKSLLGYLSSEIVEVPRRYLPAPFGNSLVVNTRATLADRFCSMMRMPARADQLSPALYCICCPP